MAVGALDIRSPSRRGEGEGRGEGEQDILKQRALRVVRETGSFPLVPISRGLLGVLLLMLWAGALLAETIPPKRYLIDVWRSERGLPQNTVTGIAQTPDGFLWLSTLDGLARFDGASFRMYKAGNTPALGSGRIRFLFASRRGGLWIATQEGGVIQYEAGLFTRLPLSEGQNLRSPTCQVAEDELGAIWLSNEDGVVARFGGGRYQVVSTNWGRGSFQVRADAAGKLWVLSGTGAGLLSNGPPAMAFEGRAGQYTVLCPARSGGWWVSEGGSARLWREGRWLAAVPNVEQTNAPWSCSLEDREGNLWVGTAGAGLFRCGTNGTRLQFTKRDGLGSDSIRVLFEDGEGSLWVGTEAGGLGRLRPALFTVYGTAQGLSADRITSVAAGPGGDLWVGTDGCGLNRLDGDVAALAGTGPEMASLRISGVLADRRRHVWLGVRYGGVYRLEDGQGRHLDLPATASRTTRCLFEDKAGAVWIGQFNTTNLVRIEDDRATLVPLPASAPPVDIRVMAEDGGGGLWIGTDGGGLWHWRQGQFTRYSRENGLGSDFIWWLHLEPDGGLWIGTYGGGLSRLKDGRIATCTTRHGLVDDVICYLADDGRGQFWFSSNQGIFRASKAELQQFAEGARQRVHCVAYGQTDGLPTLECEGGSQSSGCRTADGRLWFPTIRGLVCVDPASISTNALPPPVHLEACVVDGQPVECGLGGRLQIDPGKKRFEFHYTGVSLVAPDQLRFRHRLEGVDAEWVETGGQRSASYTELPRGAYRFLVQACNREGVWNQAGASLDFVVLPYFWQTGWFMGLFLTVFGGVIAWGVGSLVHRRHQRHLALLQRLHAAERERTRIARDIHDDLGSSLTEIGLLGALALRESKAPPQIREQVARIVSRAQELTRKLDETVWAVNPKNDSLEHLATYLCQFAREFLEPTGIRCRLDVAEELPAALLRTEVRHNVFLAVKESLHNVVQHAGATEVWLRVAADPAAFRVEVADNGHGFAPEAQHSGNGLRNLAARMEESGGQFEVHTGPEGTTIRLRLPLSAAPS